METNRLVGRADDLARLVDPMVAGRSAVALVSGEPGIGKTRLLREFAAIAADTGRAVAFGRATEFESSVPFAMFTDALPGTDLFSAPSVPLDVERFRLYRAVRAHLERLALVLVLDDVHWADPASIELLEYLLRRPPGGGAVLALAYRPRQLPVRMRASVSRDLAEVIELGPLSVDDVAALLPSHSREERQRLHAARQGNPLYLQALARAAGEQVLARAGDVPADARAGDAQAAARAGDVPADARAGDAQVGAGAGDAQAGAGGGDVRPASLHAALAAELDALNPSRRSWRGRPRSSATWWTSTSSRTSPRSTPPPPAPPSTSWSAATCCAPRRLRAGSRSGIRSCGRPRTRRPTRPGGPARTGAPW